MSVNQVILATSIQEILSFWFEELSEAQWWQSDPKVDADVADRFGDLHDRACKAELWSWRVTAEGRLAEVIILDQFSRNLYRGDARAFAQDGMALALAQEAISLGLDKQLSLEKRAFLYLPYMHSESAEIHKQAIALMSQPGLENNLDFEIRHKEIIDRFGRYPHRNVMLGRNSSQEEQKFLEENGRGF